jgi:hypothetical protein
MITINDMVRQHFLNALNRPSHCYDFLKEGAHNVKWGQLIFTDLRENVPLLYVTNIMGKYQTI